MSSHYFDENPEKESRERLIKSTLRGRSMTFISDQGVFSKNEIDFGSGLLVNSFEWPDTSGNVLDMGCGYGPIGITLAHETERTVWLADVNRRALLLAKKNAEKHGLNNVEVIESNLFSSFETTDRFAAILTNPPIRAGKKTVHLLFEQAHGHLRSGGTLWIVIQKKQGAPSADQKLKTIFDKVEVVEKKKGYYIFCATKH